MIVACPSCQKKIKAPDSAAGKKAKCPSCGTVMMLPALAQDAEVINQDVPLTPPPSDPLSTPLGGGGISDLLDEADDMYSLEKTPGGTGGASPSSSDPFASGSAPSAVDSGVPRRPCPACGEMIIMSALKCRFCGEAFDPGLKRKQRRRGGGDDEDLTTGDWLVAILCSGIGCIAGLIWIVQGKPKGGKMLAVSFMAGMFWSVVRVILETIIAVGP